MLLLKEIVANFTREDILNIDKIFRILISSRGDPKSKFIAIHKAGLQKTMDDFRKLVSEVDNEQ